jgi:hypothetical protein
MEIKFSGLDSMEIMNIGGSTEQEILFQRFVTMLQSGKMELDNSAPYTVGADTLGRYTRLTLRLKEKRAGGGIIAAGTISTSDILSGQTSTSYDFGSGEPLHAKIATGWAAYESTNPIWKQQGFTSHDAYIKAMRDAGYIISEPIEE